MAQTSRNSARLFFSAVQITLDGILENGNFMENDDYSTMLRDISRLRLKITTLRSEIVKKV